MTWNFSSSGRLRVICRSVFADAGPLVRGEGLFVHELHAAGHVHEEDDRAGRSA